MRGGLNVTTKSKVYVIDPKSAVEAFIQKGGVAGRGIERTEYSPDDEGPQQASSPWGARAKERRLKGPFEEQGSALLAFLSYLAGPYAILTTRHGRDCRFWVTLAILSSTGAAVLIARVGSLFAAPRGSGIAFIVWLLLACLAALAGVATWAQAAFLLGRHKGHLLRRLPGWLRHPATAGALGLLIPGFGLFVARHPRRAAMALLCVGALAVSVLVLWQAPDLWRLSRTGILFGYGDIVENMFLAMGALGAFGALVWIFQALDGARLAGSGGENPAGRSGDFAAVALIVAVAALLVTFKPARVAETLDRFAVSLREDGLRVIPLAAAEAAMRLDPSRPEYAVRAIALDEALGRPGEAEELRRYLAERWKPYERMLRLEASAAGPDEPLRLTGPAEPLESAGSQSPSNPPGALHK
jgi:hypothetical protein